MTDAVTIPPVLPIAPPRLTVFDTGSETCPQGQLPGEAVFTVDEAKHALNPLQHLPVVGMIYQQVTGEHVPAPLSILGSVAIGAALGPAGIAGSVMFNFVSEVLSLKPDTSRPPVPEGMDVTGSEAAMRPVSPGSVTTPGGYTTLATVLPDFLGGGSGDTQLAGSDPSPAQRRFALDTYAGTMTSVAG